MAGGMSSGAGQIINDRINQELHTLVLEGGTSNNGDKMIIDRETADTSLELSGGRRLLFEEHFADLFVFVGDGFDQILQSCWAFSFNSAGISTSS